MTVTIDTLSDAGAWQDALRWLAPFLTAPAASHTPAEGQTVSAGVQRPFHATGNTHD